MADPRDRKRAPAPVRWLSPDEQRAWIAVCQVMLQLPSALDAQLQRDSDLNLFGYLALSRLSMAPNRTLRMSELAVLAGGSLSRLSNVIKRLELRGYVRREPDPENRRFTNAILTDPGWEKVVAAAPGHVEAVRASVFDRLGAAQISALAAVGEQLGNGKTSGPAAGTDQAVRDTSRNSPAR